MEKCGKRTATRMKENGERNDFRDRTKQFAGPRGMTVRKRTEKGKQSDSSFILDLIECAPRPPEFLSGFGAGTVSALPDLERCSAA